MDISTLNHKGLASVFRFCDANNNSSANNSKPVLDTRRTHDLVDEAFLRQKDVLLDMLESKLKEVRDKKKKKAVDRTDINSINLESKCDPALPRSGELKMSANGISAIGEIDAHLKFGESGKGTLKLNAAGISNVGRSNLDLGVEDGNVHIPGISNLFMGNILSNNCNKQTKDEAESDLKNTTITLDSRRNKLLANDTTTVDTVSNGTDTHDTKINLNVTENVTELNGGVTEAVKTNETIANVTGAVV